MYFIAYFIMYNRNNNHTPAPPIAKRKFPTVDEENKKGTEATIARKDAA